MSSSSSAQKCYYSYVATRCLSSSTLADGKPKTSLETGDLVLTDSPLFSKDIIKGRKESTGETGSFPSDGLKRCIQARLLRDFNRLPGGTKVLITELSIKPPGCSFYCAGSTYSLPIDKFDFGEADDLAIAMHNYSAFGVEIKAGQIVWTLRRPTQHRRKWLAYLNGKADYFPEEYALSLNEAMNQLVKFAKEGDFDSVRKLANPTLMKMHGLQGRTVLLMLADADTYARRTAKCADYMIHLGCNPSATDSKGDTAAHLAAGNNNLQLLALLAFESKWLQNYQGLTPLMVAVEAGKWRCIKHLLHLFRQNKYHQFKTKYLNEMKVLSRSDHLAQLQAVAPCEHQRTICKCDVPDEKGRTKLWRISSGTGVCSDIMNEAIRADPTCADATGNTCLHAAVNSGNLEAVRELIALDVNVNAPAEDGSTPLMRLASSDCCSDSQSVQVAKKLLENDANWNLRDRNGCTALQLARKSNKHSLVAVASSNGDNTTLSKLRQSVDKEDLKRAVNTPDNSLKTPVMLAALNNYPTTIKLLHEMGATDLSQGWRERQIGAPKCQREDNVGPIDGFGRPSVAQDAVYVSPGPRLTPPERSWRIEQLHRTRAGAFSPGSRCLPVGDGGDRAKLTALAHAAMRGNKDCIAVLLSLGAEPHTEDFSGNTPLIWAARENHVGVIEKLSEVLQNLSNWTHRGEYNMSALEWATYLQHHKIANLIVLSINSLQTDARAQEAAQEMPSIEASEAISAQLPLPALLPNDRYRMLSRPSSRGVAIMINNVDFDNTDRRNGAMADTHETGLYQAFVKLGLRVEIHHNLSSHFFNSHNLISLNRHETEYEQHDVFVLCVMSHGEDGHIIGSDGGRIELEPLFNQVRQCDSLAGKPKIL
uniref:CASPASE_P20 domain-containing protein n=1 Tax=Macrostomum lignano TaxID=282301 RepID=A0A1I8G013_9PLAT